ncbi:MAG: 2Fe-2S iron-sulfur cluster binding domain-containing protein [Firmicutes bacterium]|nr:2Fe-2S iron-sulfur cluster binding domain-containing protein [Bacillota bacterium]
MAKIIKLTIDGRETQAVEGTTILEAAAQLGIDIPTLCHEPGLRPAGVCRVCVVEVEGRSRLQPACVTPVAEGMDVKTESAAVIAARRAVLALIMANHDMECLTCPKTRQCALQTYFYRYGLAESNFAGERREYPVEILNPWLKIDRNKCILCTRCVRQCEHQPAEDVLAVIGRGICAQIGVFEPEGAGLACATCGECVRVCPTGALVKLPSS